MKEKNKVLNPPIKFKNLSLTTLGWELALPIFGGVLLGFNLDKALNTNYLLTIGLLMAGVFTGYYNLFKIIELETLRAKAAKKRQMSDGAES